MLEELDRPPRGGATAGEFRDPCSRTRLFLVIANSWRDVFKNDVCDHSIKELCRVYVSRSNNCEYCGNQRSLKAAKAGLEEAQYDELLDFEKSKGYDERQKAALAYAEAITWHLDTDDPFWQGLYKHFPSRSWSSSVVLSL